MATGVLEGRNVLITGAGQGLGAAYALDAAAEGACVVVNDVAVDRACAVAEAVTRAGGRAVAVGGSVACPEDAAAMVRLVEDRFGPIGGLVNNAGLSDERHPLERGHDRFLHLVEVNLIGSAVVGIEAARAMVAAGTAGAIVNVTSGSALGIPTMSPYGATKGALMSLTYGWALELEPHGIRVNAVSPLAYTPSAVDSAFARSVMDESQSPAAVAPVVSWLLSALSDGVTGQVVGFDGRHLTMIQPPRAMRVASGESWDVDAIDRALRVRPSVLTGYGLTRTLPPRDRVR